MLHILTIAALLSGCLAAQHMPVRILELVKRNGRNQLTVFLGTRVALYIDDRTVVFIGVNDGDANQEQTADMTKVFYKHMDRSVEMVKKAPRDHMYLVRVTVCKPHGLPESQYVTYIDMERPKRRFSKLCGAPLQVLKDSCQAVYRNLNTTPPAVPIPWIVTPTVEQEIVASVYPYYLLICKAFSFYPQDISMRWLVHNKPAFAGLQLEANSVPHVFNLKGYYYDRFIYLFVNGKHRYTTSCQITHTNHTTVHHFRDVPVTGNRKCMVSKGAKKSYNEAQMDAYMMTTDVKTLGCGGTIDCGVANKNGYSCKKGDALDDEYTTKEHRRLIEYHKLRQALLLLSRRRTKCSAV
ncbi:ORF1 [Ranid herpesvirus 2]|uniref:ORF1 n=1 Tax=Ranid herpesvirus 2 TaxID=389214 RepID=Q14WA5_9VIRU|nr:ORF1 [Ranid herpesvirus 2]ABG25560.1 ORF1 [Ranid herpesvirus 2]